jgi:hypothetical protein
MARLPNVLLPGFAKNGKHGAVPSLPILLLLFTLVTCNRRSLTVPERVKFVEAVNCLISAPPKFQKEFPIVENRYDDFVALHVNTTQGGKRLYDI